jgi:hypothetical protein
VDSFQPASSSGKKDHTVAAKRSTVYQKGVEWVCSSIPQGGVKWNHYILPPEERKKSHLGLKKNPHSLLQHRVPSNFTDILFIRKTFLSKLRW